MTDHENTNLFQTININLNAFETEKIFPLHEQNVMHDYNKLCYCFVCGSVVQKGNSSAPRGD